MDRGATVATRKPLRRWLLFIVIVWSIGGAFLGLEALGVALSDPLARLAPSATVLPKQSNAGRAHCEQVVRDLPRPMTGAPASVPTSYAAWRLGYILGLADGLVAAEVASGQEIAKLMQSSRPISQALAVPDTEVFVPARIANALPEFRVSLEEDRQCVAAALESRYSARHAMLFKFGAVVGLATTWRRLAPDLDPGLQPEIRIYGSAALVPDDLWKPLLKSSPPNRASASPNLEADGIAARIDAFIKDSK